MNLRDEIKCEVGWRERGEHSSSRWWLFGYYSHGKKNMSLYRGRSVAQVTSFRLLTAENHVQSRGHSFWVSSWAKRQKDIFDVLWTVHRDIQSVPGGMCQTSGGCSLC